MISSDFMFKVIIFTYFGLKVGLMKVFLDFPLKVKILSILA